jgi:hypothetical protein
VSSPGEAGSDAEDNSDNETTVPDIQFHNSDVNHFPLWWIQHHAKSINFVKHLRFTNWEGHSGSPEYAIRRGHDGHGFSRSRNANITSRGVS